MLRQNDAARKLPLVRTPDPAARTGLTRPLLLLFGVTRTAAARSFERHAD
jgi:hypothetical protein